MGVAKYQYMVNICEQISIKAEDAKITDTVDWIRTALEKVHKPTMALISFNFNHAEHFSFIKQYMGIDIPKEIEELRKGMPVCLILDYHETLVIMSDDTISGDKIIVGFPDEQLKKFRIVICDEIRSKKEWLELSDEIDTGCLIVNATMAMNQAECDWLTEYAKLLFTGNGFVVAVHGKEWLNEEQEVRDVRNIIEDKLKRSEINAKIFEEIQNAMIWMETFLKNNSIQELHDERIVRNGLDALSEQMKRLADRASIDENEIQSVMNQLEKQKKTLELAGQLAAESILCNEFNRLKVQACDSICDYGQQMAGNIRSKIVKSSLDELEAMDNKINDYISGVWDYYLNSMSLKMETEIERIMAKLTKQMELDTGVLISNLDEAAREIIYEAIGLRETDDNVRLEFKNTAYGKALTVDINIFAISDQLRKETRNMMLLSIPLLLVNPLLSIGSIFAAKYYGKVRAGSELKNVQEEAAKQIENICFENTEVIMHQIEKSFNDAIEIGVRNVKKAYDGLVWQIEEHLNELMKKQEDRTDLQKYLKEQADILQMGWNTD